MVLGNVLERECCAKQRFVRALDARSRQLRAAEGDDERSEFDVRYLSIGVGLFARQPGLVISSRIPRRFDIHSSHLSRHKDELEA